MGKQSRQEETRSQKRFRSGGLMALKWSAALVQPPGFVMAPYMMEEAVRGKTAQFSPQRQSDGCHIELTEQSSRKLKVKMNTALELMVKAGLLVSLKKCTVWISLSTNLAISDGNQSHCGRPGWMMFCTTCLSRPAIGIAP